MTERDYPLFLPPVHLAQIESKDWSGEEAEEYAAWLLDQMPQRIRDLLDYFGVKRHRDPVRTLECVGERVAKALRAAPFAEGAPGRRRLTSVGFSLAADMGLLVADCLCATNPNAEWRVLKKPRGDLAYNKPVLMGLGKIRLDPVGGSIGEAFGVLDGDRDGHVWAEIFKHWSKQS